MDKYLATFDRLKKENRIGFCPFAVLGDHTTDECLTRIKIYLALKPDFLELGIPFSDPIADGPVIQAADERALKNGATPEKCIALVKKIRALTADTPIGILCYANTVLQYGIERLYTDLKKAGADSILIADVPLEEINPFAKAAARHALHQIFIVSENTEIPRLKKIEKYASGFLYVVSTLGVTGIRKNIASPLRPLIQKLKKNTRLPLMVGFGISTAAHMAELQKAGADGGIVGSALVKVPTQGLASSIKKIKN